MCKLLLCNIGFNVVKGPANLTCVADQEFLNSIVNES